MTKTQTCPSTGLAARVPIWSFIHVLIASPSLTCKQTKCSCWFWYHMCTYNYIYVYGIHVYKSVQYFHLWQTNPNHDSQAYSTASHSNTKHLWPAWSETTAKIPGIGSRNETGQHEYPLLIGVVFPHMALSEMVPLNPLQSIG